MTHLPKNAQHLIDTAIQCGWSYAVRWGQDSAGYVFVTVSVAGHLRCYDVTWHTRNHGTMRLFKPILERTRHREMASLSEVIDQMVSDPQQWVLDYTQGSQCPQ